MVLTAKAEAEANFNGSVGKSKACGHICHEQ